MYAPQFALELKPTHKVCKTYAQAGVENGVEGWGVGTVLYGSVKEWCVGACWCLLCRCCVVRGLRASRRSWID